MKRRILECPETLIRREEFYKRIRRSRFHWWAHFLANVCPARLLPSYGRQEKQAYR